MKRLLSIALAFCAVTVAAYAQPKLTVEGGDTHDWGKVKPAQSPLKTTLRIKNTGNQELKISDVKVGCGCTTTGIGKKELTPGESTTLDISLNLGTHTGGMTKTVTLTSNDPASPTKTILLKADVVRGIQILPTPYFAFNDLKPGRESTAKVTIKNTTARDVILSDIEATNGLKYTLKNKVTLKANSELEISVKYKPKAQGYYNAVLKMKTTNPDFPTLEVPAFGNALASTSPVYKNK